MPAQHQLPLPFPRAHRPEAADFVRAATNDAALTWLDRVADWPQRRLALWGRAGTGKTHLLHSWVAATGAHYLTGPTLPGLDALPDLPADRRPGHRRRRRDGRGSHAAAPVERRRRGRACRCCSPPKPRPRAGRCACADLALAACAPSPRWRSCRRTTRLLRILLARLLADRQQRVPADTQDWLLTRLPRTPAAMREAVDRLDRAALGRPGGISRPLARDVLADMIGADPDEAAPDPTTTATPATPAQPIMSSSGPSPQPPALL